MGITQEELARRAGLHRTYIADIERGARNVTLRSLANLAKALQLTVGRLFPFASAPVGRQNFASGENNRAESGVILLVGGSATDAKLALRAFKRAKFANPLKVAPNGRQGLDYLFGTGRYAKRGPSRPQLILLDLHLPDMSGLEFLRRIKRDASTREIKVIILTDTDRARDISRCCRLGAENYILKPLGFESFIRITAKLNLRLNLGPSSVARSRASPVEHPS